VSLDYKKVAVPNPNSIRDTALRQMLQALVTNQNTLFASMQQSQETAQLNQVKTSPAPTTATTPYRGLGALLANTAKHLTLAPHELAHDEASLMALANKNYADLQTLNEAYNALYDDLVRTQNALLLVQQRINVFIKNQRT
jgi:hypothetical protein